MRARYWTTVILAGFAVYSAIAVLGGISAVVYFSRAHVPVDWNAYVANRFLEQYTCALFVAPLFWLVDRFPLIGASWRRHALVLVAAILCFIVVKYAIMLPLYRVWTGHFGDPYWLAVVDNVVPVSFDFLAIIGVAHALRYYRDVGERERAAAELKTQLVQARLDALRGQLHPHFIFNSLNAAATLMHDDVHAADRMLTQLADLLRMSLDRAQSEITLGEELELADRYLAIMRYRFSDRLTTQCTAAPGVRNAMVPTFFIQPLIENALEHGIARRPGPGRIDISAHRVDGMLEVLVTDDGPGVVDASPAGIGLSNTRARLDQLYGRDSTFELETRPGGGACAVVRIPFRECVAS
jgi:two-component system, LytTR family, sensor kinase